MSRFQSNRCRSCCSHYLPQLLERRSIQCLESQRAHGISRGRWYRRMPGSAQRRSLPADLCRVLVERRHVQWPVHCQRPALCASHGRSHWLWLPRGLCKYYSSQRFFALAQSNAAPDQWLGRRRSQLHHANLHPGQHGRPSAQRPDLLRQPRWHLHQRGNDLVHAETACQ